MKYEKATAKVISFECEDIITTSDDGCAQPSFDAEYCDGVNQAVTKPF